MIKIININFWLNLLKKGIINKKKFNYAHELKEEFKIKYKIKYKININKKDKKDIKKIRPTWEKNYWDNYRNIKFKNITDYRYGKIEIYKNNILIDEIVDHKDVILDISYNGRLNMFVTCSYDGLICTYVFPNKLISIIKHPKNLHFDKVSLSSDPFPTIIAYEKNNNCLYSYSLNGMFINSIELLENKEKRSNKKVNIAVKFNFDVYGGCHKDRVVVIFDYKDKIFTKKMKVFDLPFFNESK